jgi:hypothetical protein
VGKLIFQAAWHAIVIRIQLRARYSIPLLTAFFLKNENLNVIVSSIKPNR